jgi:hypothetical protein
VVKKAWDIECLCSDPVSVWQFKIRNVIIKTKGWCRNIETEVKRNKTDLMLELDALDGLSEQQTLTVEEKSRRKDLILKLDMIRKIEEIKAR